MKTLRVLIVDDSVLFRSQIRQALEQHPEIQVVGVAANGKQALEKLKQLSVDLVVLDLEMPEMDGIQTLQAMKREGLQTRVIVFSAHSTRGAKITLEALSSGAADFVPKGSLQEIQEQLLPKVLQFVEPAPHPVIASPLPTRSPSQGPTTQPRAVVIASSTGGPAALEKIFAQLRGQQSCPILIVQHMPPMFTTTFAERLCQISGLNVGEAIDGEPIQSNRVYLAPGDFHLSVTRRQGEVVAVVDQTPPLNYVRPAADILFSTAAQLWGSSCMGLVLTGMGSDGLKGARELKDRGGWIMTQSASSCVVYGMPRAVDHAGLSDRSGDLIEIAKTLQHAAFTPPLSRSAGGRS